MKVESRTATVVFVRILCIEFCDLAHMREQIPDLHLTSPHGSFGLLGCCGAACWRSSSLFALKIISLCHTVSTAVASAAHACRAKVQRRHRRVDDQAHMVRLRERAHANGLPLLFRAERWTYQRVKLLVRPDVVNFGKAWCACPPLPYDGPSECFRRVYLL